MTTSNSKKKYGNFESTNEKRLLEFIHLWSLPEWKKVNELGKSSYSNFNRKSSKTALDVLIVHLKTLKTTGKLDLNIFKEKTALKISISEWRYFTSEILNLCNLHLRLGKISKDFEIFQDIGMQHFFLNQNMKVNHLYFSNRNYKSLYKNYSSETSIKGALMAYYEEILHFDIENKEARQDLISFNNWIAANELYYYENKLRIACALLQRMSYKNVEQDGIIDFKSFKKMPKKIKNLPQISLYLNVLKLHKKRSRKTFTKLWDKLNKELNENNDLSKYYLEPLYYHLLNFCIHNLKLENYNYLNDYVSLNEFLLSNGLLLEQGYINSGNYKNIVKSYILLEQYDKAYSFMKNYEKKLLDKSKNSSAIFAWSYYFYNKGNFEGCISYAKKADNNSSNDDLIKLEIKQLLILSYFRLSTPTVTKEIRNLSLMLNRKSGLSNEVKSLWKKTLKYLHSINEIVPLLEDSRFQYMNLIENLSSDQSIRNKDLIINYINDQLKNQHLHQNVLD